MRNLSWKTSEQKQMALALGAWGAYALAFAPLYRLMGAMVAALAALPVGVMGWLFGMRAGLLAGMLAIPLNVLLLTLVGGAGWDILTKWLAGNVLLVLIGTAVGRLRDLGERELAERKRAEEALLQRNSALALLNSASQALSATLDLDQVLAIVLEEVRRLMGAIACSVWLNDPATDELVCRQATGPQSDVVYGWRLAPGEGIAGWVVRHGESLIVPDVREDERHFEGVEQRTRLTIRSILSIPLRTKQDVIGVLQVMDVNAGRFSATDLTLLEPLAASAAVAIDNVRLVKALRQRTAELEARNEELGRFTYVASHNLRTPLVTLQGFAAELRFALEAMGSAMNAALPHLDKDQRQAVAQALQEDIPEALDFIDSSTTQMDRLTNALLELSRLNRRKLKLELVDMGALVQTTLQTLAHQIEQRQVKVTVEHLPEVVADQTSMEQIMGNLLTNAVIYLDPDRPGEIEITAESSPDETTFHIRDNGRGIAEEDMDKVFAPFRRAGRQDVPGEGMGLPYVQTLVRRHGGRIWVESEPGKGSTFYFTIPAKTLKVSETFRVS